MILYLWMMVQVICESLPISSSGHVALLQFLLHGSQNIGYEHIGAFDDCLQGISAIIFFIYFFAPWWQLIIAQPIALHFLFDRKIWQHKILPAVLFVLIADFITFVCWYADFANYIHIPLYLGFLITAGVLWSMQYAQEKKTINIWSWKYSLIVGFVQGCALFSGVSRFACTMASLQWLGYCRLRAFLISFLIEWPLIFAASVKGFILLQDASTLQAIKAGLLIDGFASDGIQLFIDVVASDGMELFIDAVACSSVIAYLSLYAVQAMIDKNNLWKFSYYMILPTTVALWMRLSI